MKAQGALSDMALIYHLNLDDDQVTQKWWIGFENGHSYIAWDR